MTASGAIRRIRVSPEYRLVSVDSGRSIDMGRGGRLEPQPSPTAVYASSASSAFASFRSAVSKLGKPARTLEAPSVERKPATIFAADVEGYSRLMGRDEAGLRGGFQIFRVIGVCMTRRWRNRDSNPRSRTRRYRFECRPELIGSCGF